MSHKKYIPNGLLNANDANRLYDFQEASINGDKSQIAEMVQVLDKPANEGYAYGLPRILARLGATEALPVLDTYISSETDSTLGNLAKAAKCRIIAENDVQDMPEGKEKAERKIHSFLQEIGMTTTDLNASLLKFQQPQINAQGKRFITSSPRIRTLDVAATDEIADMVYHGSYQDYASSPEVAQINFQADYPAFLKIRLASLTPKQRITTMINDLANKTVLRGEDNYEIQLLANEGLSGSKAAAIKIREMEANKNAFAGAGFGSLIEVIAGVGDVRQLSLVEHLEKDTDITTANSAYLAKLTLQQGTKRFTAYGY